MRLAATAQCFTAVSALVVLAACAGIESTDSEFFRRASSAGLQRLEFSRGIFQEGTIVRLDAAGNIVGSPRGNLQSCYNSNHLIPRTGSGQSGDYVSMARSGIKISGPLSLLLPFQISAGHSAVSYTALQVPTLDSVVLTDTAIINEVIYAPNYKLTFFNSNNVALDAALLDPSKLLPNVSADRYRVDSGSIVFNQRLPLLYTTYRPATTAQHPQGRSDLTFTEPERQFLDDTMAQAGLTPDTALANRLRDVSFRIRRTLTYVISGSSAYIIDEISGKYERGRPRSREFVLGSGSSGGAAVPTVYDNLEDRVRTAERDPGYGRFEVYRLQVGEEFSFVNVSANENAICVNRRSDHLHILNRYDPVLVDSFVVKVYLDRTPRFADAYRLSLGLSTAYLGGGKRDSRVDELHQLAQQLSQKGIRPAGLVTTNIKERIVFFADKPPGRGISTVELACP